MGTGVSKPASSGPVRRAVFAVWLVSLGFLVVLCCHVPEPDVAMLGWSVVLVEAVLAPFLLKLFFPRSVLVALLWGGCTWTTVVRAPGGVRHRALVKAFEEHGMARPDQGRLAPVVEDATGDVFVVMSSVKGCRKCARARRLFEDYGVLYRAASCWEQIKLARMARRGEPVPERTAAA